MAWAGGVWDGTNGTDTSNIAGGQVTYYDRKFLKTLFNRLVFAPLGQSRDLPKNEGKTIQFFRYNDITVSPSGAYLTEGTNPDPTAITGQDLSATLAEWGMFSQHSSLIQDTHLDRKLAGVSSLWGENAASTMDLLTHSVAAAEGLYPMRADGNGLDDDDYGFKGTVDSATTTTIVDADLSSNTNYGGADHDLNQSVVVMLTGTSAGQARPVTAYTTALGTVTVTPAWDVTPVAGDTFHVVSAHSLTTSHKLTTANVRKAVTLLRNNKATPMRGQYFVGVLSPDTEEGLMSDTNWTNVMQYKDGLGSDGLFSGEVGEWGGVRWIRETQPFRFPITTVGTAGAAYGVGAFVPGTSYTNYSATGAVFSTPILGMEAFGTTTLKGSASSLKPGIIIKNPGAGDTSNPLNRFSTVGWSVPFVAKGLNPKFGVQIWSGA